MSLRRRKKRIKNQKNHANEKKLKWVANLPPKSARSSVVSAPFFRTKRGKRASLRGSICPVNWRENGLAKFLGHWIYFSTSLFGFRFFFEDDLSYLNSSGKRLKGSAIFKGFTNKFSIYCVTSWIIGRDFQWKKKKVQTASL